ncbi:MAG: hypothetical protein NT009_09550 [Proteobacteria bacterium]|nr:hypothetical protein [Pseudomonadota bacterium]
MSSNERDEFSKQIKECLSKRASYICSNPDCRCLTVAPSEGDPEKYIFTGKASHLTAASKGGPRYDPSLSPEQRSSIENGIYLCSNCADMIDKNNGLDFPIEKLKTWKNNHEKWVRENLNKSFSPPITTIDGSHGAKGKGEITGLDIQEPAFIKPGTTVTAEGVGKVTGTRISYNRKEEKK